MTVISKLFETDFKYKSCESLFHPGLNCKQSLFRDLIYFIFSNTKFYLPIALIPFLMKLKRLNRKRLKDTLTDFLEMTTTGYLIGNTITMTICLLRNILGKYYYFTVGAVPGFLAGFWLFGNSDKIARFFSLSIAQTVVETILRKESNPLTRRLNQSKILQTFIFMACSGILLQLIQQYKYKTFWFVQPPPHYRSDEIIFEGNNNKTDSVRCTHKTLCRNYILSGIKEHFLIGFALENAKLFVRRLKHIKSISQYFKEINFNSISFLVSYICIYRSSYCLLNNHTNVEQDLVHLLAGYLGGISYIFLPKQIIFAYAIVASCEVLWRTLKKRKSNSKQLQKILNFPFDRAIFPVTLSIMVHNFVLYNDKTAEIAKNIVNGATNMKGDICIKRCLDEAWRNQIVSNI